MHLLQLACTSTFCLLVSSMCSPFWQPWIILWHSTSTMHTSTTGTMQAVHSTQWNRLPTFCAHTHHSSLFSPILFSKHYHLFVSPNPLHLVHHSCLPEERKEVGHGIHLKRLIEIPRTMWSATAPVLHYGTSWACMIKKWMTRSKDNQLLYDHW